MNCPRCNSGAVVGVVIRQDIAQERAFGCASCGNRWSDMSCSVRAGGGQCGGVPTLRCVDCTRYVCSGHEESRRGRLCRTCSTRLRKAVTSPGRGPRFGNWSRTGGLHQ